jgi:predicted ATPase
VSSFEGVEQGTHGDSFFAVFTSPSACVGAALDVQRSLGRVKWHQNEQPLVRMGIHTGEVSQSESGLVGYEVHRAARIAAVGHGGQVLLSSAAAGLVEDVLPEDVGLRNLGSHRLKDLGRPETIYQLVVEGLRDQFPPLRSLDNPELPNNLPASLNPFVGRVSELEEVRSLVTTSRMVTLTGAGGSGKTRLALQVAAELLDGSGEGVWFVDFAPVSDPAMVPVVVMSALQIRPDPALTPMDSLLKTLRDQTVLITLDNCEHLIDSIAKLSNLVGRSCPRVWLLATSREPLGVDAEQVYRVRSMSLPTEDVRAVSDLEGSDAVALFLARARARESTFVIDDESAPLVASICRRLDGIPLAIELAASRLSSMSIADLHDRLDQRFRLLTGGSRNALPRQQTLGAMVAWSYDLLNEPEREVLRRLSVFVGGCDLRAAESVCATASLEAFDVADILNSLVNKSLVAAERSSTALRYRLLETIRQFAADQMIQVGGEAETSALRRRHADHFRTLCEEAGPRLFTSEQAQWLRRLDAEWDNILASIQHFAAEPDGTESILSMCAATYRFLHSRFHLRPLDFLLPALAGDSQVSVETRARALLAAGLLTTLKENAHRLPASLELMGQSYDLATALGDPLLTVEVLCYLAWYSRVGGRDSAETYAREAIERATTCGSGWALGMAQYSRDFALSSATEHHSTEEALRLLRASGDLSMTCVALMNHALESLFRGDALGAKRVLDEAMAIADDMGSTFHSQILWIDAAVTLFLLGDVEEAERYSRQVVFAARRSGRLAPDLRYWLLFVLSCCATSQGKFARGARLAGAHDAVEAEIPVAQRGYWPEIEVDMREQNRARLVEALGDQEYVRLCAEGAAMSHEQMVEFAMNRPRIDA